MTGEIVPHGVEPPAGPARGRRRDPEAVLAAEAAETRAGGRVVRVQGERLAELLARRVALAETCMDLAQAGVRPGVGRVDPDRSLEGACRLVDVVLVLQGDPEEVIGLLA